MCAGEHRHACRSLAGVAARARVHRGHEHEAAGKQRAASRPRDRHAAFLERLPHQVEHAALKLRQLVEKEHAVVGERDFARPRLRPAAHERRAGDRMMRRAERPARRAGRCRPAAGPPPSGSRVQSSASSKVSGGRIVGEPPRQHRLAGARRAAHQQVVAAGRRDLERPPRRELPAHVREVGVVVGRRRAAPPRFRAGRRRVGSAQRRPRAASAPCTPADP